MSENRIAVFSENCINLYGVPLKSTLAEAYKAIAKIGIGNVEVFDYEFADCPYTKYGEILKASQVKPSTVIAFFSVTDKSQYPAALESFKKAVDAAAYLKSDNVLVVPVSPFVKTEDDKKFALDFTMDCLLKVIEYKGKLGTNICIENFSKWSVPFSTTEEVCFMLDNIPGLKYNFDPGNFYCVYEDALKAYSKLKNYVVNVHLKDWVHLDKGTISTIRGEKLDGVALGRGIVKLPEIMKQLNKDGYSGKFTIEINTHRLLLDEVLVSYDFIKNNM